MMDGLDLSAEWNMINRREKMRDRIYFILPHKKKAEVKCRRGFTGRVREADVTIDVLW